MLLINRTEEVVSSKKEIGIELNPASEVIFRVAKALQAGIVPNVTVESDCWLELTATYDVEIAGMKAISWITIAHLNAEEIVVRSFTQWSDEEQPRKTTADSWKVDLTWTPMSLIDLIHTLVNKNH
jgi:hypothetical protein